MEAAVSAIPRLSITGKDSFSRIHRANKLYRSRIYTHTNSLSILPPCIKIIRRNPPATIYTCCGAVEACAEVFLILGDWSPSSDFPISLGKHETRRAAFDTLGCNNIFIFSQLAFPRRGHGPVSSGTALPPRAPFPAGIQHTRVVLEGLLLNFVSSFHRSIDLTNRLHFFFTIIIPLLLVSDYPPCAHRWCLTREITCPTALVISETEL